jgi:hypothetical protein
MKGNKALKRLAKIEALMSDLTERYSASAPTREVLQDNTTFSQPTFSGLPAGDALATASASNDAPKGAQPKT